MTRDPVCHDPGARSCRRSHARDHDRPSPAVPTCSSGPRCPIRCRAPARCSSRSRPARSTGPTCCSGRGTTRRRRARPPYPGLECSGVIARSARGDRARWASRSARCWPAAGTPSRWRCRPGSCCRSRGAVACRTPAALPEVACTVWSNVVRHRRGCGTGETLLVHGGGSGIGTFAIQLGTALGATRAHHRAGGQARRAARARRRRDDRLHRREDFVAVTRSHRRAGRRRDPRHHGRDLSGPQHRRRSRTTGGSSIIGLQGGRQGRARPGRADGQARHDLRDHAARPPARPRRPRSSRAYATQVWPLVEAGRIRPVIDHRAADGRGRRGAPAGRGERPHRQGAAHSRRDAEQDPDAARVPVGGQLGRPGL